MFQDRTLTCRDCGEEFVFSASEQEFFAEKGFNNDPSRCHQCRAARKNRNRNNGYGDRDRRERQHYPAVCSMCNTETTVPFKPSGERPVYCNDCYRRVKNF